jgi:hypothetical protein
LLDCGFDRVDHAVYNADDPAGDYELDLSSPYDRAVALELLEIAGTMVNVPQPGELIPILLTSHRFSRHLYT